MLRDRLRKLFAREGPDGPIDFDDQSWPIHLTMIVLGGFSVGVVHATSSFSDPRLLYNGWVRMAVLGCLLAAGVWAVVWLETRMRRRVLLCVLMSLMVHLGLALFLHGQYLALVAKREAEKAQRLATVHEPITVPDYYWDRVEHSEEQLEMERPVEIETPEQPEIEMTRQHPEPEAVPIQRPRPSELDPPLMPDPERVSLDRAEISAPRRAEAVAGAELSRQEWKQQPRAAEPIPLPKIPAATDQSHRPLEAQVQMDRQPTETSSGQRQSFQRLPSVERQQPTQQLARRAQATKPEPLRPTTPAPTRRLTELLDMPHALAQAPDPVRAVEQPRAHLDANLPSTPRQTHLLQTASLPVRPAQQAPLPLAQAAPLRRPTDRSNDAFEAQVVRPRPPRRDTTPRLSGPSERIPEPLLAATVVAPTTNPALRAVDTPLPRQTSIAAPAQPRHQPLDLAHSTVRMPQAARPSRTKRAEPSSENLSRSTPTPLKSRRSPRLTAKPIELASIEPTPPPTIETTTSPTQPRSASQVRRDATVADASSNVSRPIDLPTPTRQAQPAATVARRNQPTRPTQPSTTPARSTNPTRSLAGIRLPSTIAVATEPSTSTPAGAAAPSRLQASSVGAVERVADHQAPQGERIAAAGSAESALAVGSTQLEARMGQPRSRDSGQPSISPNAPTQRIARSSRGIAAPTAPAEPVAPVPSVAAVQGGSGPELSEADAPRTSIERAGSVGIPATNPSPTAAGSGPSTLSGSDEVTGPTTLARVMGAEPAAAARAGGGTPRPSRRIGRAFSGGGKIEEPTLASAAPSSGEQEAGPTLQARRSAQGRAPGGRSGRMTLMPVGGALASRSTQGPSRPATMGRRADASQPDASADAHTPDASTTLARSDMGIDLPAIAAATHALSQPGAAGLVGPQGSATSALASGPIGSLARSESFSPTDPTAAHDSASIDRDTDRLLAMAASEPTAASRMPDAPTVDDSSGGSTRRPSRTALAMRLPDAAAIGRPEDASAPDSPSTPDTSTLTGPGEMGLDTPSESIASPTLRALRALAEASSNPSTDHATDPGQATGDMLAAATIGRAPMASDTAETVESGVAGPARRAGRAPRSSLTVGPVVEPAAEMDVVPAAAQAEDGRTEPSLELALAAGTPGELTPAGGLPGELVRQLAIERAQQVGPEATLPGVVAGLRRFAEGDRPTPRLAAEVGGGPVRRTIEPGLPLGAVAKSETSAGKPSSESEPTDQLALAGADKIPAVSRRDGGLPVLVAARAGPGGLLARPGPTPGILDRRANPRSEFVQPVPRRFVLDRSGGDLALDGRVYEAFESFRQRDPSRRGPRAAKTGGTPASERAIELGLAFLARHQFPDGRWALDRIPHGDNPAYKDAAFGSMHSDTAATGLGLLAYLGAGYTHHQDKHQKVVRQAIDWLVAQQQSDGALWTPGNDTTRYARSYAHGIATIALCEAYGMTRDPALREPARRAIEYIVATQHATRGGWRYTPPEDNSSWAPEADTSVSGWQLMALKSAQMAKIEVPPEVLQRVSHWLDLAEFDEGAQYAYNPYAGETTEQKQGKVPTPVMTAEGLLMRLYLGRRRDHDAMVRGADHLLEHLPGVGTTKRRARNVYYWYYATQVMHQMQGEHAKRWNDRLFPLLESSQHQEGVLAGSWHPDRPVPDRWAGAAGRHYVTTLNILMLEVHTRHLPLYKDLGE